MPEHTSKSIIKSIGWVSIGNIATLLSGMISLIVIARILDPADFGLYITAILVIALPGTVSSTLANALIQKSEISEREIKTVNGVSVALSMIFCAALFVLAPTISDALGQNQLVMIVRVCAFFMIFDAITSVSAGLLTRNMEFKKISAVDIISGLISVTCGITFAILLENAWALVIMEGTRRFLRMVLFSTFAKWLPSVAFDMAALKRVALFGTHMTLLKLLVQVQDVVTGLIVGRVNGPAGLGLYNLANRLLQQATQTLIWPASVVAFPLLAKAKPGSPNFRQSLSECISLVTLISFPAFAGAFVVVPELIPILFGEKWSGAIVATQIALALGVFRSIATVNESVLSSVGKPERLVFINCATLAWIIIGLTLFAKNGLEAVMLVMLAREALLFALGVWQIDRAVGIQVMDQLRPAMLPLFAASGMFVAIFALNSFAIVSWPAIAAIGITIFTGILSYAACLYLVAPATVRRVLAMVKK
ncbi:MAG: oligosaccharide flippase family protein [Henriciella sp.]|nr:oligosaccharide flippase family protein [Henriciella sp.]